MKKTVCCFLILLLVINNTLFSFADEEEWICPNCGEIATMNFCSECGEPKPLDEWECPNCGEIATGNFCSNCGASRNSFEDQETGTMEGSSSEDESDFAGEEIDAEKIFGDTGYYLPFSYNPIGEFSNGLLWVKYYDGAVCYGAVDKNARVIFSIEGFIEPHEFQKDGYAYYSEDSDYVIIDSYGNECYRVSDTDDTNYTICGHGDNMFLLRMDVANMTEKASYISQIGPYGEELKERKEIDPGLDTNFKYYGEGIFKTVYGWSNSDDGFYSANTGNYYHRGASDFFIEPFEDGKALYHIQSYDVPVTNTFVTPEIFDSVESYDQWIDSLTEEDEYYDIPELSFPESVRIAGKSYQSGGYYPYVLEGADGNFYFTISDEKGEMQYSPVQIPSAILPRPLAGDTSLIIMEDLLYVNGYLVYKQGSTVSVLTKTGDLVEYDLGQYSDDISFDGTYIYAENSIINIIEDVVYDTVSVHFMEDIDESWTEGSDSYTSEDPEWLTFDTTVTTEDGYDVEIEFYFSDRWIDSNDYDAVDKYCNELNIDSLESVNRRAFPDLTESNPHFKYIFGKVQCDNVTEGWDITEDNPQNVYYSICPTSISGENISVDLAKSHYYAFYSDGTVIRNHTDARFGITLKNNMSGRLPVVIAAYNPTNPNYPDGDNWYKDVEIICYGSSLLYGNLPINSGPEIEYIPKY